MLADVNVGITRKIMGSEGGNARKEKLSPEQRKAIASAASKARWAKVREKPSETPIAPPEPIQAAPEPPPAPVKKVRKAVPKEFGKAHSYADKRLAAALKEWLDCTQKLKSLQDEIPRLARVIQALGGTVDPEALAIATRNPLLSAFGSQAMPAYPMQPQTAELPQMPPDGIDPNLYKTNAAVIPGLPPPTAPIIPGAAMGGGMDLDYTPKDDEPAHSSGGGGWA
jgi:hypothetical protein